MLILSGGCRQSPYLQRVDALQKNISKVIKKVLTSYSASDNIRSVENTTTLQFMKAEVMIMFYWYTFADGYKVCARGFDRIELKHEILKHGKLMSKVRA